MSSWIAFLESLKPPTPGRHDEEDHPSRRRAIALLESGKAFDTSLAQRAERGIADFEESRVEVGEAHHPDPIFELEQNNVLSLQRLADEVAPNLD